MRRRPARVVTAAPTSGDGIVAGRRELVVFSPLPPTGGGIAEYSAECLTGLAAARRCTLVTEHGARGTEHGALGEREWRAPDRVRVMSVAEYRHRHADFAGTPHLYHLGNNIDHAYMLPILTARPGLIVLHDTSLHRLLACATIGDNEAYADAIAAEAGAPGRVLARQFRAFGLRERAMMQDMPMLTGVLGAARGVIVHSRYAAARVWARARIPARILPMHHVPPDMELRPRAVVRIALGVGADEVMFLSLGSINEETCIEHALLALAHAADRLPPFRYVVAGAPRADHRGATGPDMREVANRLGLGEHVKTPGAPSPAAFHELLAAADIVINLRHRASGRTSRTLARALGAGACCVVIDRGPCAEVPEEAVEKITWGAEFDRRLGAKLIRLAHDPELRVRIGAAAARFSRACRGPEGSVAGMLKAIDATEAAAAPAWCAAAAWSFAPRAASHPSVGPLWHVTGALPLPRAGLRAVHVGPVRGSASLAHGWSWERAALETVSGSTADLVLFEGDAAALGVECVERVRELNRILRMGGMLVLSLERTTDGPRCALERSAEGTRLLEACGFTVHDHVTAPNPGLGDAPELALRQAHCWRAVKSDSTAARPDWSGGWQPN